MAALAASTPAARPRQFRGLLPRMVSAVILGPLCLAAIWFGFPWIDLMAAVAAPIVLNEWIRLTSGQPVARCFAILYGLAAVVALLWLRHQPDFGRETVLWIIVSVWATDIGAYFLGSLAGGAKLAPTISPAKTWSGLIGGMCFSAVASAACGLAFSHGDTIALALVGVGIAAIAQAGDLLESAAKRRVGLKDSGHLIPGHGGLLDRIDGLIAALVVIALARLIAGGAWPWA
ncbi:phosphatidate cytidylyltransferase [Reyranella sp.]|jgi:phosphatidate cytidylyltransferase|uniref:phosphatidate cytidylyltransferase n=1 Tax=Reyranella sp. TaxID=1929291 RepID=UPI002F91EDA4